MRIESPLRQYVMNGAMFSAGFEPTSVTAQGMIRSTGFGAVVENSSRGNLPLVIGPMAGWDTMSSGAKAMAVGPNIAGLGFAAYNIGSGYLEEGWSGAYRNGVIEMAASAATSRFAYGSPGSRGSAAWSRMGIKRTATELSGGGMMNVGARFVGANIGASIGYSLGASTHIPFAGMAGAAAGGYVGAAPLRFARTNPGLALAGLAVGGVATLGYGAYHVSKRVLNEGYAHSQSRRGVNTDGDMAAFMTGGAITMRERAVQSMNRSHLNARSALGQEANFMHSGRDYSSRYR